MTPLSLIGGGVAGLGVLIVRLRGKLRRAAIPQNESRVGSALLNEAVTLGAWQAWFIIRGEAAFQKHESLGHGGLNFQMMPAAEADTGSPVLRRFIEAACRVLRVDAPA